jgi:hypothetical protein
MFLLQVPRELSKNLTLFILYFHLLVLGQGGHWAPVTGFDGAMPETSENNLENVGMNILQDEAFSPEISRHKTSIISLHATANNDSTDVINKLSGSAKETVLGSEAGDTPHVFSEHVGGSKYFTYDNRTTSQAHVFVGKKHGGGIYVDDPAFLAEWSVDAIKLIRKQLRRAGNGRVLVPFENNWSDDGHPKRRPLDIPKWARKSTTPRHVRNHSSDEDGEPSNEQSRVAITDIPLMTAEVSALLDIMEDVMEIQRFRRLEQLRAPSWFRSNWYVVASVIPLTTFFIRRLSAKGYGREIIHFFFERVVSFFRERVVDPVAAM